MSSSINKGFAFFIFLLSFLFVGLNKVSAACDSVFDWHVSYDNNSQILTFYNTDCPDLLFCEDSEKINTNSGPACPQYVAEIFNSNNELIQSYTTRFMANDQTHIIDVPNGDYYLRVRNQGSNQIFLNQSRFSVQVEGDDTLTTNNDESLEFGQATINLCSSINISPDQPNDEEETVVRATFPRSFVNEHGYVWANGQGPYHINYYLENPNGEKVEEIKYASQGFEDDTIFQRSYSLEELGQYDVVFYLARTTAGGGDRLQSGLCQQTFTVFDEDDFSIDPTLCDQIPDDGLKEKCQNCLNSEGIWTAIGCVPTNPTDTISTLIKIGIGIGGGVAMLSIIAAGFLYTTSSGDASKTTQAKELMTSAVIGLLFVIFSITILQFIAGDLLQIPGFGV